jgi:hypothetical protein
MKKSVFIKLASIAAPILKQVAKKSSNEVSFLRDVLKTRGSLKHFTVDELLDLLNFGGWSITERDIIKKEVYMRAPWEFIDSLGTLRRA